MQNKIKICVTNVWDIEKMWNFANLKIAHNLSYSFFNMISALNAIDPYKSTKNFSTGCMAVKWVFFQNKLLQSWGGEMSLGMPFYFKAHMMSAH